MNTFIVLSYNQEQYIEECLNSIKDQIERFGQDKKIELILADDASTDRTREVCNKWIVNNKHLFTNIITIFENDNVGLTENYYRAIENATGEKIKVVAGDDLIAVNNIIQYFDYLEEFDVIFGNVNRFGDNQVDREYYTSINTYRKAIKNICQSNWKKKLIIENFIYAPSVFIKKSTALKCKQEVCQNFRNVEDYPTWLNLFYRYNSTWKYVDDIIVNYRCNPNSISTGYKESFIKEIIHLLEYKLTFSVTSFQKIIINSEKLYFKSLLKRKRKLFYLLNINNFIRANNRIHDRFIKIDNTLDSTIQKNIEYCKNIGNK